MAAEETGGARMTMRVSRDGGRTYGERIEVGAERDLAPADGSAWPPCRCPQHQAEAEALPPRRRPRLA